MYTLSDDEMQMLYDRRGETAPTAEHPWVTTDSSGKWMYYGNFDWYNYLFRKTRPETEHNVTVSGGNKAVNYFVSGRFLQQDGMHNIYNDRYKNYSFRAKLNVRLSDRVRYSVNMNFNSNEYKYAGYFDESKTLSFFTYNLSPLVSPRNTDGTVVQYINQLSTNSPIGGGHAGMLTADKNRNTRLNNYMVITNQLDVDLYKDLTLTASYSYRSRNRINRYRNNSFDYSKQEGVMTNFVSGSIFDYYQEYHGNINHHNVNAYLTYDHTWAKKHNVKAVAGVQWEDYRANGLTARQNDLLSDDLASMSVATGEMTLTQNINAYRTLGYFARVNYDYEGRYLAEVSGRWDGTSRFSSKDRWGFFPSASAGWRISGEDFWDGMQNWWNNAKLRVSVGSLGNQQVDYYAYIDQVSTDNKMSYTFDGKAVAYKAAVSDPISANLTWETVTTYNLGIDLGFLNNRLTATADIYRRDTKNMLTQSLTLPSVFGANTPEANCADLRTNGWEIYVRWNDSFQLAGRRFGYSISASLGDYMSKITKYNNPNKLISDYYEGKKLGEIWGYQVAGLFATDEEAAEYQSRINDKNVNNRVYLCKQDAYLRAGDVKFIDRNNDGKIDEGSGTVADPGDKTIIGNSTPRYSYSFRLDADYAGFDISAFFQGVGKRDWYPSSRADYLWGPYSMPSASFIEKDFLDKCWSEDNPGGYFPRQRGYQSYSGGALYVENDRYIQNIAYLRLKNLTVGYTLPLRKNPYVKSIRLYFTGENLAYWSPLKKWTKMVDPEMAIATGTQNADSGVTYGYSKSFSFGIDVKF